MSEDDPMPRFPAFDWDFSKPMTDEQAEELRDYNVRYRAWRARREQHEVYRHAGFDFDWPFDTPPIKVWEAAPGITGAVSPAPAPGFNGYVLLPKGHRYNGRDLQGFDEEDPRDFGDSVSVHGGITFGPHLTGWVGFDTSHAFDKWDWSLLQGYREKGLVPDSFWTRWELHHRTIGSLFDMPHQYDIHWTLERLEAEVASLALQVHLTTTEEGIARARKEP